MGMGIQNIAEQASQSKASPDRSLWTELETADFLSLKSATLEAWRCRGGGPDLPYVKIGRTVRYRREDVLRVVEAGVVKPREVAA
jgi:hypothetical protein